VLRAARRCSREIDSEKIKKEKKTELYEIERLPMHFMFRLSALSVRARTESDGFQEYAYELTR